MVGPPGLEPGTNGFTDSERFRPARTISSPVTRVATRVRDARAALSAAYLLLRTLDLDHPVDGFHQTSGSLCTFRQCTAGLAQGCHRQACFR